MSMIFYFEKKLRFIRGCYKNENSTNPSLSNTVNNTLANLHNYNY